jgi:predicted PurR-regulated permease PerM
MSMSADPCARSSSLMAAATQTTSRRSRAEVIAETRPPAPRRGPSGPNVTGPRFETTTIGARTTLHCSRPGWSYDGDVRPSERIRSAGITAWALIGIGIVAWAILVTVVGPLSVIIAPLAIALVIVYLLNPLVSLLEREGVRRGLGVALIYLVFLAIVSAALGRLIPLIGRELSAFIEALPGYVQQVVGEVNRIATQRGWALRLDVTSEDVVDYVGANRATIFRFLGGVSSVAGQLLHIVITVLLGLILSIYLLLDLPKIRATTTELIPRQHREEVLGVLEKIGEALGGFFRGQLFVAAFVGVASALVLTWPVHLPFAVLVGLIAGILNLVPLIGPVIAMVPAVMLGLLSGTPSKALGAVVALLIVQQIDNHLISPNVMGRTVRLHPVTVMLALLVGGTLAGILGMLIVIPIVAAVKILAGHLWARRRAFGVETPLEPAGEAT